MTSVSVHPCPICRSPIPDDPRYPRAVCETCYRKAVAPDGRALKFSNVSFSGGYQAKYLDTGEAYESHECVIDGIRCLADEAHMGGIVIQVAEWPAGPHR